MDKKEYTSEYNKKYYLKNREKFLEYMSKKIECDTCMCSISQGKRSHHLKSKKHLKNLNNKLHAIGII